MKRKIILSIATAAFLWMAAMLPACKKTKVVELPPDTGYSSRIAFLLQYNPAVFQYYYSDLLLLGLTDSLTGKGPFTVLAYNNQAVQSSTGDTAFTSLSIIPGLHSLDSLPAGRTEIIDGPNGFKWLITANVWNGQVQYTINGAPVLLPDQPASNGFIDVMANTYPPFYYPSLLAAIQSNTQYIDFSYALQRTHLDTLLADTTQTFTVFVPVSMGGLQAVGMADLDSLTKVVKYLIVPGRIYGNTLEQMGYNPNVDNDTLNLPTLSGENMQILVSFFNPGLTYDNLYAHGLGDGYTLHPLGAGPANVYGGAGITAGLGVIQSIDQPLAQ